MRLLNVHTWEMKTFASKKNRPPYAILSHTWGENEVSLQNWESGMTKGLDVSLIPHSDKVRRFGEMVKTHAGEWGEGFIWIWVDTCCIDQKSSAELSEAINSMYAWYQEAARCYAYLEDVALLTNPRLVCEGIADSSESIAQDAQDAPDSDDSFAKEFTASRWFTRGWTLQELIAPSEVIFINQSWQVIGAKNQQPLTDLVSSCTGIPGELVAQAGWNPRSVTIADRMSWAANRETTRPEDIAYSLLGLMTVNLPLLYGEGEVRAFHRLQEEVMKTDYDQTILAWGDIVEDFAGKTLHPIPPMLNYFPEPLRWVAPSERPPFSTCGLLADSPRDFNASLKINVESHGYHHVLARQRPPTVVNGGVLLDLVIANRQQSRRYDDDSRLAWYDWYDTVVLMCVAVDKRTSKTHRLAIALHAGNDGYHTRTRELCLVRSIIPRHSLESMTHQRHVRSALRSPFTSPQDWFIRSRWSPLKYRGVWSSTTDYELDCQVRWENNVIHFAENDSEHKTFGFIYRSEEAPQESFEEMIAIVFRRSQRANGDGVDLYAAITQPVPLKAPSRKPDYHSQMTHFSPRDFSMPETTQWHLLSREWKLCKLGPVAGWVLAVGAEWLSTRYAIDYAILFEEEVFRSTKAILGDASSS